MKKTPQQKAASTHSGGGAPISYDELPDDKVFTLDISGEKGVGKTHLACSFPKSLAIADTEYKAYTVAKKFDNILWKRVENFADVRSLVQDALDNDDIKTVVVDSGADLVAMAGLEWNAETGKNYRWPISNYGHAYDKVDELILPLEENRKYFVATSRMKDEWIGDVSTGRRIRDGYKKFPWSLSLNIHLRHGIQIGSKTHFEDYVFGEVTKSNFHGIDHRTGLTYSKPYLFECTFEGIQKELLQPWGDGVLSGKRNETIVAEAEEWIKQYRK